MAKKKVAKRRRKSKDKQIARTGDMIRFCWPSWVCPKYVLKGVVTAALEGECVGGGWFYKINYPRQERFKFLSGEFDDTLPSIVGPGQTGCCRKAIEKGIELAKKEPKQ